MMILRSGVRLGRSMQSRSVIYSRVKGFPSISFGASFSTDSTSPVGGGDKPEDVVAEAATMPPPPPPPISTLSESILKAHLTPSEVVAELDKHIVGQAEAKRAVAIALRNRWRRRQLPEDLQKEVTPRNVLMIGPTGCGKTEVARRMAELGGAPFLKVEATKFTEVGYHGRDVDQIIRDLVDVSLTLTKKKKMELLRKDAEPLIEERLLDLLTGEEKRAKRDRNSFRDMLRQGHLDDMYVELDVPVNRDKNNNMFQRSDFSPSDADMEKNISQVFTIMATSAGGANNGKPKTERKSMPISEARKNILQMELERMMEAVDLKKEAIAAVEESGIVFLDEIDKICSSRDTPKRGADASDEGVQRDLLPLIEGTTINTKHGNVNTDFILFVASGAFHAVKPSDMLPELQGRLPIRVYLQGLTENDLYRILTEPVANLIRQQIALLATEGVRLSFQEDAIREIARMAAYTNQTIENIGARRLHTVLERIMEELSFEAAGMEPDSDLLVTKEMVKERLSGLSESTDLQRYIL